VAAAGDAGRANDSVATATHDLYRQYGKQIYAYCLHQLRTREEAEDAVQTTFLNAFRGLQRGTTTRFEQAWLYKIAANVCIARRSSSGRRLRLEAPDDFEMLEEIVPSGSASAGDTLELMGLDDALEQMPENQRRAILLREWQGLSYREIASELGLSQGAVEMLIFRARRTLALALEEPTAAKRRIGKAKTGFSFGSLIAAMKGLFSAGAAMKMAAVAVSAAVAGSGAVRSVAHRIVPSRYAPAAAVPLVERTSSAPAPARTSYAALVSYTAPAADVATDGRVVPAAATGGAIGPRPVLVDDAVPPSASAQPAATDQPSASEDGAATRASSVTPPAPVRPTPPAPGPSASSSPPQGRPEPGPSSEGKGGEGNGKGKGSGHQREHAGDRSETSSAPEATTTATSDAGDPSTSIVPTTTTDTTSASTTTTTSTTTETTTDTTAPTPADSSGGNGNGHGNGNGGGGHHDHGH
jgi:RNA polymerase sigma factor (sigma-70 family)